LAWRCGPCFEPSNGDHVGARRFRHRNSAVFIGIGRGLRAVMRPLLQDPGYAVIALKHDIDPPPGLVGQFLNVAREVSGARSSSDQLGSTLPTVPNAH
jgi:hypothetical protein